MKSKLFLLGLLSFFYVNSQVIRLVELPAPIVGITNALTTILDDSGTAASKMNFVPSNDDCDNAIELPVNTDYACGTVTAATLSGATDSGIEAEVGFADDDVWFSFVATGPIHKISLLNIEDESEFGSDLVIEVMSGTCGNQELVTYSDPQTVIVAGLEEGGTYYMRVFSYLDYVVNTTFDICIGTPPPAPANDDCSGAVALTVNTTVACTTSTSGTLQSASDSGLEAETGDAEDDVWYSFVATATAHIVRVTDIEGSHSDLVYEVTSGVCDDQEIIKSSDADSGIVGNLTIGTTYYLRIFTYSDDALSDTTFKVCVATPGAAPANDECSTAVTLAVNAGVECTSVTAGTLLYATDSGIDTDMGVADDDVWYSFTATETAHKISLLNVEGDNDYLVMEFFAEGCDGEFLESEDEDAIYLGGLTPETVYYVRVFTYTGELSENITFDICVSSLPPAPVNDECDGAIALTMNPDYLCGSVTSSGLLGSTDSGFESEEIGGANDDVWFSFTATTTSHKISLRDVEASNWMGQDIAIEIMDGDCNGFSLLEGTTSRDLVLQDLIPEMVYYVRIFSTSENIVDTTFDICIGTTPDAPANDECDAATVLTVNPTMECISTTSGTLQSATDSGIEADMGTADDDVWYSFVATSPTHLISLENVEGEQTYVVFEVIGGECDSPIITSNENRIALVSDLTVGTSYHLRVFTFYSENNPDTTFDVCIATPGPAPVNDECDAAIELTVNPDYNCAVTTPGTLAFATDSGIEAETGNADDDVWFSFLATSETQKISLSNILGNVTYLAVEVFEGDCGSPIFESVDSQVLVIENAAIGMTYYVRVYSYYSELAFTTFDICVGTMPLSQPNDECEDATALTVNLNGECDVVTTSSLASATDSGVASENGDADDDVWFSFVAAGPSQKVQITSSDSSETLILEVFEGTCGNELTVINDEDSPYVDGLTTGNTYYVRVFSYEDYPVDAAFDICVALRQSAPANDDCAGAISLNVDAAYCNGVLNNGTNLGATDSGIDTAECFNYGLNDVWFSFTVPANTASVDISTDFTGGTLVDTEIALYSGTCINLTEIACDQDSGETVLSNGSAYNSVITDAAVTAGATYFVRVSGYSLEEEGKFCLEISTNESLSTGEFTKNTLKAYPNPVKNILNLSNTTNITDVTIFNLLGQQVVAKTVNANEGQIDMSNLSAGAYLVKVTADNAVQTIKIIKE